MSVTRRSFLSTTPFALAPVLLGRTSRAEAQTPPATSPVSGFFPAHGPEVAREMVGASHANLPRVKELLATHPSLARAAWDWGFGDWEDALGAASHMGNRDIAALLVANGARPTIFSATMLGQLEVVKGFIVASPGIESTPGPHGITLLAHAAAGGSAARPVFDYLKTLPDSNKRPASQPITREEAAALAGDYVYGQGTDEKLTITAGNDGALTLNRGTRFFSGLVHAGDMAFFPAGAPQARIRFSESTLTVRDPDLIITAKRA